MYFSALAPCFIYHLIFSYFCWLHKYHENGIAGQNMNSLSPFYSMHKFIPMRQAMKMPDPKATVEKEWEKYDNILAV